MTRRATGAFEVTLQPLSEPGAFPGRMSIDKQFSGDLEGIGKGEMLTALTQVEGSAGYVAIETVTGTLEGRQGTFVLQHSGVMDRGKQMLSISVVPDSGTGELAGLTGLFSLSIVEGKHLYAFDYTLPE